jgi:tRNA-binding protein
VVCVLGFEPKRIAGFPSEVLVLGAYSAEHGVVLLQPDRDVEPGSAIG